MIYVRYLEASNNNFPDAFQLIPNIMAVQICPCMCEDTVTDAFPYVKRLAVSRVNKAVDVPLKHFDNFGRKKYLSHYNET